MPAFLAALFAVTLAGPKTAPPLWDGSDISGFRTIQESGLSDAERVVAYGDFILSYPQSPLSEVALERCLSMGADVEAILARLQVPERTHLVASFRNHKEYLLSHPHESSPVTEAETGAEAATGAPSMP